MLIRGTPRYFKGSDPKGKPKMPETSLVRSWSEPATKMRLFCLLGTNPDKEEKSSSAPFRIVADSRLPPQKSSKSSAKQRCVIFVLLHLQW